MAKKKTDDAEQAVVAPRYLGSHLVLAERVKIVNGREYLEVRTATQTRLLTSEEVENVLSREPKVPPPLAGHEGDSEPPRITK